MFHVKPPFRIQNIDESLESFVSKLSSGDYFSAVRVGGVDYELSSGILPRSEVMSGMRATYGYYDLDDDPKNIEKFTALHDKVIAHADLAFIAGYKLLNSYRKGLFPTDSYFRLVKKLRNTVGVFDLFEGFWRFGEWLCLLEGKTVLVVSSFEDSIRHQLKDRQKIFAHLGIRYPDFELKTVKTPITFDTCHYPHRNLFETADILCDQVRSCDFDFAMLGCGAYSIPILDTLQSMRKSHLYLGGMNQMYFGVYGGRYDTEFFRQFMNDYWIRPLDSDKPKADERSFQAEYRGDCLPAYF